MPTNFASPENTIVTKVWTALYDSVQIFCVHLESNDAIQVYK